MTFRKNDTQKNRNGMKEIEIGLYFFALIECELANFSLAVLFWQTACTFTPFLLSTMLSTCIVEAEKKVKILKHVAYSK